MFRGIEAKASNIPSNRTEITLQILEERCTLLSFTVVSGVAALSGSVSTAAASSVELVDSLRVPYDNMAPLRGLDSSIVSSSTRSCGSSATISNCFQDLHSIVTRKTKGPLKSSCSTAVSCGPISSPGTVGLPAYSHAAGSKTRTNYSVGAVD